MSSGKESRKQLSPSSSRRLNERRIQDRLRRSRAALVAAQRTVQECERELRELRDQETSGESPRKRLRTEAPDAGSPDVPEDLRRNIQDLNRQIAYLRQPNVAGPSSRSGPPHVPGAVAYLELDKTPAALIKLNEKDPMNPLLHASLRKLYAAGRQSRKGFMEYRRDHTIWCRGCDNCLNQDVQVAPGDEGYSWMHAIVIHLNTHGHSYPDDNEPCKNGRDKWIDGKMSYQCNICNFFSESRTRFCDHIAYGWTQHTVGMAHNAMVPPHRAMVSPPRQDAMDDEEILDILLNRYDEDEEDGEIV